MVVQQDIIQRIYARKKDIKEQKHKLDYYEQRLEETWTKEGGEVSKLVTTNFKGCRTPLDLSPDQRKVFLNTLADRVAQKSEQAKLV